MCSFQIIYESLCLNTVSGVLWLQSWSLSLKYNDLNVLLQSGIFLTWMNQRLSRSLTRMNLWILSRIICLWWTRRPLLGEAEVIHSQPCIISDLAEVSYILVRRKGTTYVCPYPSRCKTRLYPLTFLGWLAARGAGSVPDGDWGLSLCPPVCDSLLGRGS